MTIQLVQHGQFDSQIQTECYFSDSDKTSLRARKKTTKIVEDDDDNDDQYLKLYEAETKQEQLDQNNTKPIFSFILKSVLNLIKFYLILKNYLKYLYYTIYLAIDCWLFHADDNLYFNQVKLLNLQIPRHVCVVTNEDLNNCSTIRLYSTIIDSLSIYGVETITFYQFGPTNTKVKQYLNDVYFLKDLNNNCNGKKSLNLNFLSNDNGGNRAVVNACKSIASKILNKQLLLEDISQDLVNSQVIEISDIIEPEMILLIGSDDNLSGFCSWHLRLTEIIKIPSHKLVNALSIRDAIVRFNKIEKRFGK